MRELDLIRETKRIAYRLAVNLDCIMFLVWNRLHRPPLRIGASVLRAVGSNFKTVHPHVDGIACKFTADISNLQSIESLDAGLLVNLWTSDATKTKDIKYLKIARALDLHSDSHE